MISVNVYDPAVKLQKKINAHQDMQRINDLVRFNYCDIDEILFHTYKNGLKIVLLVIDFTSAVQMEYIKKLCDIAEAKVIVASSVTAYPLVRSAFKAGVYDYLDYNSLENTLYNSFKVILEEEGELFLPAEIREKMKSISKHIFDGGNNLSEYVENIVDNIFAKWGDDDMARQQIIESLKIESYKYFVASKPWLEKFIYRGNYIKDIGFECMDKQSVYAMLYHYYFAVNVLFQKYNVIDVDVTIYTIGKEIIKQVDSKITLESVSNEIFLNKSYISHIFKTKSGVSFNDFVLDVKIDRAKVLLQYPNITINQISDTLAFCNSAYFAMIFKRMVGKTPTQYKNEMCRIFSNKRVSI